MTCGVHSSGHSPDHSFIALGENSDPPTRGLSCVWNAKLGAPSDAAHGVNTDLPPRSIVVDDLRDISSDAFTVYPVHSTKPGFNGCQFLRHETLPLCPLRRHRVPQANHEYILPLCSDFCKRRLDDPTCFTIPLTKV